MSRHWNAPAIAYELAAEWADLLRDKIADSGGVRGHVILTEMPPIGKTWHDLRILEQHDVMAALGAQARSAVFELRKSHGLADHEPVVINVGIYATRMCEQARETLRALTHPAGDAPWTLPACSHCAALVATALIDVHIRAIESAGITDPGAVLRGLGHPEPPAQREAADDRNM